MVLAERGNISPTVGATVADACWYLSADTPASKKQLASLELNILGRERFPLYLQEDPRRSESPDTMYLLDSSSSPLFKLLLIS